MRNPSSIARRSRGNKLHHVIKHLMRAQRSHSMIRRARLESGTSSQVPAHDQRQGQGALTEFFCIRGCSTFSLVMQDVAVGILAGLLDSYDTLRSDSRRLVATLPSPLTRSLRTPDLSPSQPHGSIWKASHHEVNIYWPIIFSSVCILLSAQPIYNFSKGGLGPLGRWSMATPSCTKYVWLSQACRC